MAGIQRFVTYIYAYDDGEKSGNTGYAKIELRGNAGRMEVHFVDGSVREGKEELAFVMVREEKIFRIPVGAFYIDRGTGRGNFSFSDEALMGTDLRFSDMDGFCLTGSNGRLYLSLWKDVKQEKFTPDMLVPYGAEASSAPPLTQQEIIEEAELESLHTMEIPVENIFPACNMAEVWETMRQERECLKLDENTEALKMELKDLRELPKKYWYLGNNSFLLTGFFQHQYLLLGKMNDGHWFLGVPGGCGKQERVIAPVFGFPGYCQAGVWYHILED